MTTRLNGIIKMTNLLINQFTFFGGRPVIVFESRTIWAQPAFAVCAFSEFHHLFTDVFFRYEKRMNSLKDRIKLKIGHSPKHLIPASGNMTLIQEVKLAPKPFGGPVEEWSFCIIALQLRAIGKGFSIFFHSSAYIKTALSVYISSKISKIFLSGLYCVSHRCQFFFDRRVYESIFFLKVIHSFNKRILKLLSNGISKVLKNPVFLKFFNKEFRNLWKVFEPFVAKSKMIRNRSIGCSRLKGSNRAIEAFGEPKNWFFSYGNYYEMASPLLVTNLKASVSIYIAGCVGKISYVHNCIMS